jgi:hypothetical protein
MYQENYNAEWTRLIPISDNPKDGVGSIFIKNIKLPK